MSESSEYKSWGHAKGRCFTPTNKKYPIYGGRGITMCDRWRDDFEAFLEDMGECPDGHTLDRIDPNGDYTPENCRWATPRQQGVTRRDNVMVEWKGEERILKNVARLEGVNYQSLHYRYRYKKVSISEAVADSPPA